MDLQVLAKFSDLSQILWIFIDFWCQFYRIHACFWALDSCIIFSVIFGQFMCPWMCTNDVFTAEKQLFSWICMF